MVHGEAGVEVTSSERISSSDSLIRLGDTQVWGAEMGAGHCTCAEIVYRDAVGCAGVHTIVLAEMLAEVLSCWWYQTLWRGQAQRRAASGQTILHVLPVHLYELTLQVTIQHGVRQRLPIQRYATVHDQVTLIMQRLHRLSS